MTMMFHGKSSLLKCNIWKSCDLKGKKYFINTFSNCNCYLKIKKRKAFYAVLMLVNKISTTKKSVA